MKKIFFIVILLAVHIVAKEIKIGVILPLSGSLEQFGKDAKNGLDIAFQNAPQIYDYDIKIILKDNRSDKIEASNIAKKMIQEDEVTAIIGGISSNNALETANVSNRQKTPFITMAATNFRVTFNKKYATRICYSDPYQGLIAAKWALDKNLTTAVLITSEDEEFSRSVSNGFKSYYNRNGGKIFKNITVNSKEKDYGYVIEELKDLNPQIIFLTGYYPEVAKIVTLLKNAEIPGTLIGTDAANYPEFIDMAKDNAKDFIAIGHFSKESAKSQKAKEFVKLYNFKYYKDPSYMAALAADSYNILRYVIRKCIDNSKGADNKKCINSNLRDLKNFRGITGIITIDKNGNAIKPVVFDTVKDGKFIYLETVNPPQKEDKEKQ